MRVDAAQPVDDAKPIDVRHLTTTQCRSVLRARGLEAEAALDLRSLDRTALVGVLRSHGIDDAVVEVILISGNGGSARS